MSFQNEIGSPTVCVVGLGYVGLPLAVAFDEQEFDVLGFDVDPEQVEQLNDGIDPTGDVGDDAVAASDVEYTTDETVIERADFVLVTVPTPVDDLENPNLEFVESAGETIGRNIQEGATVVLESTVYPGATREILAPAIEEPSGLTAEEDFHLGYSPERMVPGDEEHGLRNVVKIVSGEDERTLDRVAALYESIVDAGVHRAPEIEVAETAKAIENVQRDLNIALMNELAIACNNLGLDTHAVLEAAGTKWNFHEYTPGLVGGHCIPVDPFYIIYESERNGFKPELIEQGREVNEHMPKHVAELTLHGLNDCGKVLRDSTVLVLGLSYKPGVGDIRTSVVGDTIEKLEEFGVEVVGVDPHADRQAANDEFGVPIQEQPSFENADAVLLATPHEELRRIDYADASAQMAEDPLVIDIDGVLDGERLEDAGVHYERI